MEKLNSTWKSQRCVTHLNVQNPRGIFVNYYLGYVPNQVGGHN